MSVPEIDQTKAAIGVLRDTLLDIPEIVALVGGEIHWKDVEDSQALPYIILNHITGGYENETDANAVDTYWKAVGVTSDKTEALNFKEAFGNLHRKELVVTNEPHVTPYSTVREWIPIEDRDVEQQTPVYKIGGIYRLRFVINPIPI